MTETITIKNSNAVDALVAYETIAVPAINDCTLEQIEDIEDAIIDEDLNIIDEINAFGLRHKLVGNLYARVLNIPKGTFLTGRIHKRPYIDIFISGDVTVKSFLADGSIEEVQRVNSFRFFEGIPGRKRVLYAHEDTIWITVDPTVATDVEKAEDEITTPHMKDYKDYFKLLEVVV